MTYMLTGTHPVQASVSAALFHITQTIQGRGKTNSQ